MRLCNQVEELARCCQIEALQFESTYTSSCGGPVSGIAVGSSAGLWPVAEVQLESRRGWQDKAQVSQERLLSMVWNSQYAKLQDVAKAFMTGTSSVCARVDRYRRRHVPGNSPNCRFSRVKKLTVDSFTRSFWLVACQEVNLRPTSL
jgi:hypothetical protein